MIFTKKRWLKLTLLVGMVVMLSLVPLIAGGAGMIDDIKLVSTGSSGRGGYGDSARPRISADGKTLVFWSIATDLIPGLTTNGNQQVYSYNIATGVTTLITKGKDGTGGNGFSENPEVSGDGTRIAFRSVATDLIAGETSPDSTNIYLYDAVTGQTTLVSKRFAGSYDPAYEPAISADGSTIAYDSKAPDLIEGRTITVSGYPLYRYDVATATTTLVTETTPDHGVDGEYPQISADGSRIAFTSNATALVSGVSGYNTFLWDKTAGFTCLSADPTGAGGSSRMTAISADGTRVAFISNLTSISGVTANGHKNAFLWDETAGLSLITSGGSGIGGGDDTDGVSLSPDGMFAGVSSYASDLVAGLTTSGSKNVFLYNLASGIAELITKADGIGGDDDSYRPSLLSVGPNKLVAFHSSASDLIPGTEIFLPPDWSMSPYNVYLWGRLELFTVTFDAQNGTTPLAVNVAWGRGAPSVANPTKAGYVFDGWWTAPTGGTKWDFSTPITADITLYAHWVVGIPPTGDEFNFGDWIADNWWIFALALIALIGAFLWWWMGRNKEKDEHALVDIGPVEDDDFDAEPIPKPEPDEDIIDDIELE